MSGCPRCGFENDRSDVFCGSCGAFLEWSRTEAGARVAVASGAPPPGTTGASGPTVDARSDVPVIEDSGPVVEEADPVVEDSGPVIEDADPAALTTEERMRRRAEALRAKPPPGSMRVTKHRRREGRAAHEASDAAVADKPVAVPPGAVKPAAPQARPKPKPAPPTRELQTGDLICGQCGEGNVPTRKFCRRCGSSLVDAEAVAAPPVPWWKRPFVRKPKKEFSAGDRPMRRGGSEPGTAKKGGRGKKILAAVGAVAAIAVVIGLMGPWRSSVDKKVASVKRTVAPNFDPVHPVAVKASTELKDHPAALATDGISNTFWAESGKGKGEGQALVLTFDPAVDINKVGIYSGASGKPEDFLAQPRPKSLHLIFSDGTTTDVSLKDTAKFQSFDVKAKLVNKLEVQIASVYSSVQGGQDAAISELEFYTKR
jgi:hypothetical protein